MLLSENNSVFHISTADTLRFRRIVIDVMTEACQIPQDEEIFDGIGTLGEKQMHAAIKRFICPDVRKHEVLIDGSAGCIDRSSNINTHGDHNKKRRFVADVLEGNTIYEIQTGGFSPLRNKIQWILDNTSYNIMLIHPIAETKWVNLIDAQTGSIGSRKKSPRKGKLIDIASQLYFLQDFIGSPRFSLVILMMEAEQYKKNIQKEGRRPKYKKYELIPMSLLYAHIFKSTDDYRIFLPENLPEHFCVKQFSSVTGIRGRDAYSIVKTLCHIGLLTPAESIGRAAGYKKA